MMQKTYFSDEELVAYLDGEMEFSPMDEIREALKTDIALAKRLERLRIDTNAVADSFKPLLSPAKPLPQLPAAQLQRTSYKQVSVAAALALLLGFSGGHLANNRDSQDWRDYVAAYQALYTNSTLNHVQSSVASQQNELNRVATAIGKTIQISDLSGIAEIEYKRAQILGFKGQALVQLAFLTSVGEPMALCILRSSSKDKTDINFSELEGMKAASWSKDGYEYILIGGSDESQISRVAKAFAMRQI